MRWFKNLGIRIKLLLSFGVVILLSLCVAVVGIITVRTVNENYVYIMDRPQQRLQYLLMIEKDFMEMRYRASNFVMNSGDLETISNTVVPQYEEAGKSLDQVLDTYIENISTDTNVDKDFRESLTNDAKKIKSMVSDYAKNVDQSLGFAKADDFKAADLALKAAIPITKDINDLIDGMLSRAQETTGKVKTNIASSTTSSTIGLTVLSIAIAALSMILAMIIALVITKPIRKLVAVSEDLAKGNLNINIMEAAKDETGVLVTNFFQAIHIFKSLVDDLENMSKRHHLGDIDAYVDEAKYSGSYGDMVASVNQMVSEHIEEKKQSMECVSSMVDGDFSAAMAQLPDKKAFINDAIEALRSSLRGINGEVDSMIRNTLVGNLSTQIDTTKYKGDWIGVMSGLNEILAAVNLPLQESLSVLKEMAEGNFAASMTGEYRGDFNMMKVSVNETVGNISAYINEISSVLNELANNNYEQEITREYVGEFSNIKIALNRIIEKLNTVVSEVYTSSEQVASGAKMISESSMELAQGATEQASSVEELNATIAVINQNTIQNAQSAIEAQKLSLQSKKSATNGDKDMQAMQASMKDITDSSHNISKIIKVIDDIAFQTNLLALNAAVEAARAGQHGKGFSVVAEQVRNLATRSKAAASEISGLIEASIHNVDNGTKTANATANALQAIVEDVSKVAAIINNIADSSNEQASAISMVTDGLAQVSEVVQTNSATSEEAASASQQLYSQAEVMKSLVSGFKLKKRK